MEQTSTLTEPVDVHGLITEIVDEIQRYLETVALFRALGSEPRWKSDEAQRSRVIELIAPYVKVGAP